MLQLLLTAVREGGPTLSLPGTGLPADVLALRQLVCREFCAYHKPSRFVEPGCAGFTALAKAPGVRALAEGIARLSASATALFGMDSEDPRLLMVCAACAYPPDGCDFRNPENHDPNAKPCGGLRALAGLVSTGVLA